MLYYPQSIYFTDHWYILHDIGLGLKSRLIVILEAIYDQTLLGLFLCHFLPTMNILNNKMFVIDILKRQILPCNPPTDQRLSVC